MHGDYRDIGSARTGPVVPYCAEAWMFLLLRTPLASNSRCSTPDCAWARLAPLHTSSGCNKRHAFVIVRRRMHAQMQHNDKQHRECVCHTNVGTGSGSCPCTVTMLVQLYRVEVHLLQPGRVQGSLPYLRTVRSPGTSQKTGLWGSNVFGQGECALICPLFRARLLSALSFMLCSAGADLRRTYSAPSWSKSASSGKWLIWEHTPRFTPEIRETMKREAGDQRQQKKRKSENRTANI